jgi:hypothetical protein
MTHRSIAITRIRDIVSTGRIMRSTHSEIHDKALAMLAAMPTRFTVGDRTYVSGYLQALLDSLWSEVEFCYRDASGVIFSTAKNSAHRMTEEFYASGRGCELVDMECAHLWRGTDKPFTAWATHSSKQKQGV